MPVLGIGIDILHISRISNVLRKSYGSRLAARILSPSEQSQWTELTRLGASESLELQTRFLAVRWCVKEAAYKAMYPTVKASWKELTYTSLSPNGVKPQLLYTSGNSTEENPFDSIHVSVSHDGDYVVSQVLVEGARLPS